jgi:hypothetical protein
MPDQTTILDQDVPTQPASRRKLLPWWMKAFSWIFMVSGVIALLGYCAALTFNLGFPVALYGLETAQPISILGLFLIGLFVLKGAVGFGLWFEKDWAVVLGLVDAFVGIAICLFVMIIASDHISYRLELVFLAFYVVKLIRMRPHW